MRVAGIRLGPFVIVLTAVVASACAGTGGGVTQDGSGWTRLPEAPLSPRYGASAFWMDGRVYVLGGRDTAPCPPNADCALPSEPAFTDGAAFDPGTSTWRRIADAPVPFEHVSGVVIGETLYAWVVELAVDDRGMATRRGTFVAYHAGEDRWEELSPPPVEDWWGPQLVAGGTRVIAFRGSHEDGHREDLVYDPATRTWSPLPKDPFAPSFDRALTWTGEELVLLALDLVENPGSEGPLFYRAAALDIDLGTWRMLPTSEVVGYDPSWFWVEGRIVNPTLGSSDGGQNEWGRAYPHGGMLDPQTGEWEPLPGLPDAADTSTVPIGLLSMADERHVLSLNGWILDVVNRTWTRFDPPEGAPHEAHAMTWAGDRLFMWGGVRWDGDDASILGEGWLWTLANPSR